MIKCFLGSLGVMGRDLSLNWRLLIVIQPLLETVLNMRPYNSEDFPPGSCWGEWRVRPAARAPEEPVEEWKARKVEKQDTASLDESSEDNPPSAAYSQGCGRHCSVVGSPLWSNAPLLTSGNVGGTWRDSLTGGPCEKVAGGGSLDRRASPGWPCFQEG